MGDPYCGWRKYIGPDYELASRAIALAIRSHHRIMEMGESMEVIRINANEIAVSKEETMRYMGIARKNEDELVNSLAINAISKIKENANPLAVWHRFPLSVIGNVIRFADVSIASRDLMRFFNCRGKAQNTVLLAATLGPMVDAAIRRASAEDTAAALALQGAGAAMLEAVIDKVCLSICAKCSIPLATRRYSPGYGDVPLEVQKTFFRLLECQRIGLTLMDTLVMAPEKSVTAFMCA